MLGSALSVGSSSRGCIHKTITINETHQYNSGPILQLTEKRCFQTPCLFETLLPALFQSYIVRYNAPAQGITTSNSLLKNACSPKSSIAQNICHDQYCHFLSQPKSISDIALIVSRRPRTELLMLQQPTRSSFQKCLPASTFAQRRL